MKKFLVTLWLLLNPTWWIRLHHYSREWDNELGKVLDEPECCVIICGKYAAKVNNYPVWIVNYPYGFGEFYPGFTTGKMPSRYNIYRLNKLIERKMIEKYRSEENA